MVGLYSSHSLGKDKDIPKAKVAYNDNDKDKD